MRFVVLALAAAVCALAAGPDQKPTETELLRPPQWAEWVEPNFPFYS
jgi:hypothetical protein